METSGASPSDGPSALRMIVLAGQTRGKTDGLVRRFAQSHRSLIPIAGQPMIAHVLRVASDHPHVASLAICIEREAFGSVWDVLTRLPGRGSVALVPAREELADSVRDAATGWSGPLIVTTADHAMLSTDAIDAVVDALGRADVAVALAPRLNVEAVHSAAPRRFLSFRDGDYAACDLYGIAGPTALRAVEVFRGGSLDGASARIRRATGLIGLLLVRCRLLTVLGATAMASRHLGLRLSAVVLSDGSQAIDVNDDRSYAVVRDLLDRRSASAVELERQALSSPGRRKAAAG